MASTRLDGGNDVDTVAGLVGRRSARQAGQLIIDSNTGELPLMRLRLSAWKASTSLPVLESSELAGIRCIAGWKGQPPGAAGSMIEK